MNQTQAEAAYQNALRFHRLGKLLEAERLYRDILRHFPQLDTVHANLAAALIGMGKPNEGLKQADQALKINPGNRDAMNNKGAALRAMGREEEGLEVYKFLVMLDPENADVHFNLGTAVSKLQGLPAALAHFKKASRLNPDFLYAWLNLGCAYAELGDNYHAGEAFRRVLRIDPGHPGGNANLGNIYAAQGRIEEAFEAYNMALDAENGFVLALQGRANLFLAIGDPDAALRDVDFALEIGQATADLLVLRGNACSELDWRSDAIRAYEEALELDPKHPGVADQIARLRASSIPLWHFTMLEDHARNSAYRGAIERAVRPGMHVLDIGTGTGLLSMMAVRAGASHVTAVEAGREMAKVAKEVVARNGFADNIEVFHMHSGRLRIGEHMPRPADVIVSEIVDAGLLGEGVMPSLRHAWATLAAPGAIMIPSGAVVTAVLAELPENLLENVEGFDLSVLAEHHWPGRMRNVKMKKDVHRVLSAPFTVSTFDFRNLPDEIPDAHPESWEIHVSAFERGHLNAVLLWFSLELDASISVSTGPTGTLNHWGQVAFFMPMPRFVEVGEHVALKISRTDKRWWFTLLD